MSNWVQLGQDINGNTMQEQIGRSLAISGDGTTLALGVPIYSYLRIYRYISSSWVQIGNDISGNVGEEFGWSVSLSKDGNILAVGIRLFSLKDSRYEGKVSIYYFNGTDWQQLGNSIEGENNEDEYGYSVSLSDNGEIVGIGTISGTPTVYEFINSNWTIKGSNLDNIGLSVSLSGNGKIFVIGNSDYNNNKGLVKIYNYVETEWVQLGNELQGVNENDNFGYSVSISTNGNYIVIGAKGTSDQIMGYFKVFKYNNINKSWDQHGPIVYGNYNYFGYSVSISDDGKRVGVGAPYDDTNGSKSGRAFIYNYEGNNWNNSAIFDGKDTSDENGYTVSLSDNGMIFAFGAPFSGVNFNRSGQVRVFQLKESKPINPSKPKKKRKPRTFIKYGQSCGVVYFITCLRSGLYRIVKKTRNNAGKLVTQEVRILPTYNVAF